MFSKRFLITAGLSLLIFFGGCATSPYIGEGKTASDALLQKQFEASSRSSPVKSQGRLIFAGFAMHSQSKAFRADVVTAEKAALAIDPDAIIFKLNNPVAGQQADWPYATSGNIELVLKKVAALAGPQDKIMILLSTHGAPDVLAVNFSNIFYPHITPGFLKEALAPTEKIPVLLMISACHSGSFLASLTSPNRIILTAAAKDRASFGCQFKSTNTYFVDALLNQPALTERSINELMTKAKVDVDRREKDQKLSPPSLPEIAVGSASQDWAGRALKAWFTAR